MVKIYKDAHVNRKKRLRKRNRQILKEMVEAVNEVVQEVDEIERLERAKKILNKER